MQYATTTASCSRRSIFEDEPGRRSAAKLLSKDETRTSIPVNSVYVQRFGKFCFNNSTEVHGTPPRSAHSIQKRRDLVSEKPEPSCPAAAVANAGITSSTPFDEGYAFKARRMIAAWQAVNDFAVAIDDDAHARGGQTHRDRTLLRTEK